MILLARRLGQARARGEGPVGDAPARGRRGRSPWCAGSTKDGGRVLLQPRHVLRLPHQRRPGVHRLRRAGAEAVQASTTASDVGRARWLLEPPHGERPRTPLAVAVSKRRLRPALRLRPHRELSTRAGPPVRASLREGDEIVGVALRRQRARSCVRRPATRRALVCKVDEVAQLAGAGQGVTVIKVGRRRAWSGSAWAAHGQSDVAGRRDGRRQGAADRARAVQGHRRAAARATLLKRKTRDRARERRPSRRRRTPALLN